MFKHLILGCALLTATRPFSAVAAPGREPVLAGLPAPVQQTIRAQLGDGKLRAVDREEEDGGLTYDVEIVRAGKTRNFTVGAEGELLSAEVFLEELPAVIQQAIKTKVGKAALGEIDKSITEGEAEYTVEFGRGAKSRSFTVDTAGKLIDEEVFLSELPGDFQKTIRKEIGGGTLDEITRSFEKDGVLYDVDLVENGKTRTLTFDAKCVLVCKAEDVTLAEVPDAAKKQIQTLSATGKLISIAKVTENDVVSFDVDIRQQSKVKSYTIDLDGKVVPADGN